ncbi:hypothetical protein CMO96_02540 [Candidatus Woesebacteria bacterium]|nr:hypothetical protein [Candidatus Woesebacteria bacterium]|tara:strand:+ start:255 stop:569 length:315 start_codon:yes stop_codon:yes gene_type:complete
MNPADYLYATGQRHPELMEVNIILDLLNQVGIPVAISVILMWFIKYQFDESRKEREEAREDRSENEKQVLDLQRDFNSQMVETIGKLTHAIENNTRVVESLKLR